MHTCKHAAASLRLAKSVLNIVSCLNFSSHLTYKHMFTTANIRHCCTSVNITVIHAISCSNEAAFCEDQAPKTAELSLQLTEGGGTAGGV